MGWKTMLLRCPYYPKQSVDIIQSLPKLQSWGFFAEIVKYILKFVGNLKGPQNQYNLEKEQS